ncbi:MAG: sulfatase-like hydrolase/transferase [Planctomycetota bacterium]
MSDTPPNLLFLFPDQWRWDWFGHVTDSAYGDAKVETPNIDRLAAQGTRFTQCRTNSPLCQPARACLATGVRYHRCPVRGNGDQLDAAEADTVFRRLREAGYRTACTGKTDLLAHGRPLGLDGWSRDIGRFGFTHSANQNGKGGAILWSTPDQPTELWGHATRQSDPAVWQALRDDWDRRAQPRRLKKQLPAHPSPVPSEHHSDGFCASRALRFLEDWPAGTDDPWLLWVNFPGPHEPFDPPAEFLARYEGVGFPDPLHPDADNDHQALRRAYAALCTHVDHWIGCILDAVEQRGEAGKTLVVLASDHGEMLGDHGRWYKEVPHEPSVHVPLILAGPGVPRGHVRDDLVELIDIGPTLLTAAGLPVPDHFDARPLPTHGGTARDHQLLGLKSWQVLVTDDRHKLVVGFDGKPRRLYDLNADPLEQHDLAGTQPDLVDRLTRRLRDLTADTPALA